MSENDSFFTKSCQCAITLCRLMKNPAASGQGIETDLLAECALHYNLQISPQGDGELISTSSLPTQF
jgi:hypothetical protein